jgi:hypothetical protein
LEVHVRQGTFRPRRHRRLLAADPLPVASPADSPACRRLWKGFATCRTTTTAAPEGEVQWDIAVDFSKRVREWVEARDWALPDPLDEIAGIREIIEVNRAAKAQWEAEHPEGSG